MMNLCVNNPVLQKCWRVFQSHVWKWHKTASDRPPLHWLTPLQVRPPFLVLMGTASHLVFMIQGLHLRSPNWYWLLGMEGSFSVVEQFCCGAHSDYYRQAWDIHLFYFSPLSFCFSSMVSPTSKRPGVDLSPQSICSSPSISRLTYISMNDATGMPTPERQKVWQGGIKAELSTETKRLL